MKKILSFSSTNTPKFAFFLCTSKKESEKAEIPLVQSLLKMDLGVGCGVSVDVFAEFENTQGLSQRYNEFIDYCKGNYSYLTLVHDDVLINDHQFFSKVINSKFDVMGPVGGCYWGVPTGFDFEHKPLIWTVATCGKGASGFMNHDLTSSGHPGVFLPSSYGPSPLPTASLDGCCLILNKHAVEKGLRFDSEFDRFDFYDHALVQSALKLNLKVGTVPILCTHGSVGAGVMNHTEEYLKYQKKFIKKYFT